MACHEKTTAFLQTVLAQIRAKSIRPAIQEELENHIADQKEAYEAFGLSSQEAEEKAVASMGDPVEIGCQLDQIHRPAPDWPALFLAGLLFLMGMVTRLGLSAEIFSSLPSASYSFAGIICYSLLALCVFFVFSILDYTWIKRFFLPFTLVFFGGAVLLSLFGSQVNGQMYWPLIGTSISYYDWIQLGIPLFAVFLFQMTASGNKGVLFSWIGLLLLLLLAKNAHSTGFLCIAVSGTALLWAAALKGYWGLRKKGVFLGIVLPTLIFSILFLVLVNRFSHILSSTALFFPEQAPKTQGFLGTQIRNILSQAQLLGPTSYENFPLLLENGVSLLLAYPITLVVGLWGFLPAIVLTILLVALFLRAYFRVWKLTNRLGFLAAFSCLTLLASQTVFSLLPNWGVAFFDPKFLPLFSFGGFGLLLNGFFLALIFTAIRKDKVIPSQTVTPKNGQSRIQYQQGKLIISIKAK